MDGRKLDTTGAGRPDVANLRNVFDQHIDRCPDCEHHLCPVAQSLWRSVCLAALRSHGGA